MSRNNRLYQGIRRKKILESLKVKEDVTKLRRPTEQEYQEVFGPQFHLLQNVSAGKSSLSDVHNKSSTDQDNSSCFEHSICLSNDMTDQPGLSRLEHTISFSNDMIDQPDLSRPEHNISFANDVPNQPGPSRPEHTISFSNDMIDQPDLSRPEHNISFANDVPNQPGPSRPEHTISFSNDMIDQPDLSRPEHNISFANDVPKQPGPSRPEHTICFSNDITDQPDNVCLANDNTDQPGFNNSERNLRFANDLTDQPDLSRHELNTFSTGDTSSLLDTCQFRRVIKSWSLSDLTQDSENCNVCKRTLSLPHLTEEFVGPTSIDSPSILLAFHRPSHSPNLEINYSTAECIPSLQNDFDNSTDSDLESVEDYGIMNEGRKRRHIAEPVLWKRNQAKMLRMQGEEFLGYSRPANGKFQQDTIRGKKELGERCTSEFCNKSKLRGCSKLTEDTRKKIHTYFWKKLNWDQRKVYVNSLVNRRDIARKTKSDDQSRRSETMSYFLPIKEDCSEKVQVCKPMFLATLSLGSFTVYSWTKKSEFGMTPSRSVSNSLRQNASRPGIERKMLTLKNFFDNLPKLPSHYARKETNKLFLEPMYNTLADLFRNYKTYCAENEEPEVSRFTFEKMFNDKNLSLYTLKKDMCDICSAYKVGNLNEADYQVHLVKKNRARLEKENDKKRAAAGEIILLTMDLESVKICPYLTASALYFKTKLTCHNFTVYNLTNKHCTCYWFDETSADLTSSTFASFLVDYLEKNCIPKKIPIVIFSDGCTYQNRNVVMANALLNLSKKNNIMITQKFLEPGHTQMECDSVHSSIERKLKNREIHLPSDYVTITREARRSNPYESIQINHEFVKDYASQENLIYKSIRPGRKAGDPQVVDIRVIYYNTMTIEVKLDFDADCMPLPQRPKIVNSENINYRQLHSNRIPISASKFNHLQQLKQVLPRDCHAFYDTLPFA